MHVVGLWQLMNLCDLVFFEQITEMLHQDDVGLSRIAAQILAHTGRYIVKANPDVPGSLSEKMESLCRGPDIKTAKAAIRSSLKSGLRYSYKHPSVLLTTAACAQGIGAFKSSTKLVRHIPGFALPSRPHNPANPPGRTAQSLGGLHEKLSQV